MKQKRWLSAAMCILMLLASALPTFAYLTPYDSVTTGWSGKERTLMDGSMIGYQTYGGAEVTSFKATTAVQEDTLTAEPGALHLAGLTPSNGLVMQVGETADIKVKYDTKIMVGSGAALQAYSDNPSVAALGADGKITALSAGVANIVAKADGKLYTVKVIVS